MEPNIVLRPMTAAEYPAFRARFIEDWAQDLAKTDHLTMAVAREDATRRVNSDLTDGIDTEGHRIFVICAGDRVVGSLWFSFAGTRGFLDDITGFEDQRGRGYGRRALELMEDELAGIGVSVLQLSVDAGKPRAKALYERGGYVVTGFRMTKRIGPF